ncbi:MAG: hypothetical protein IJ518_04680 [Clostridia bacterium]|nr:hypothetical protein [Clostridia bacterium]
MKKYECPYCGAKSLSVLQKLNNGARVTKAHITCANCGKRIALKGHWVCTILFLAMVLFLIMGVEFKSYIFLGLCVLSYIGYDIACMMLKEFVKSDK